MWELNYKIRWHIVKNLALSINDIKFRHNI